MVIDQTPGLLTPGDFPRLSLLSEYALPGAQKKAPALAFARKRGGYLKNSYGQKTFRLLLRKRDLVDQNGTCFRARIDIIKHEDDLV